jgi:ADP-ribose pyrophosphatase YjhB (NUDIX family)
MRSYFNTSFFSLVVVRDDDRYLLVEELERGHGTTWYLPAGGVKEGEDIVTAAIRETREEAGLEVEILGILGGDQVLAPSGLTTRIRLVFLGRVIGGQLKAQADDESVRAVWFRLTEIEALPLRHPEVRDWIYAAERVRDCPVPIFTCYTSAMLRQMAQKGNSGMGAEEESQL